MDIKIGDVDATTKTVSVTFTEGSVTHTRPVNACYDDAGAYDADATTSRVNAVALGVANKIALGIIKAADTSTTTA